MLGANLDGAFFWAQAVVPAMKARRWGRIVNTCSLAAKTGGLTAGTAYAVSKGALGALTFSLARELAPHGVTANAHRAGLREDADGHRAAERGAAPGAAARRSRSAASASPRSSRMRCASSPRRSSGFITGEILDLNGGLLMD